MYNAFLRVSLGKKVLIIYNVFLLLLVEYYILIMMFNEYTELGLLDYGAPFLLLYLFLSSLHRSLTGKTLTDKIMIKYFEKYKQDGGEKESYMQEVKKRYKDFNSSYSTLMMSLVGTLLTAVLYSSANNIDTANLSGDRLLNNTLIGDFIMDESGFGLLFLFVFLFVVCPIILISFMKYLKRTEKIKNDQ